MSRFVENCFVRATSQHCWKYAHFFSRFTWSTNDNRNHCCWSRTLFYFGSILETNIWDVWHQSDLVLYLCIFIMGDHKTCRLMFTLSIYDLLQEVRVLLVDLQARRMTCLWLQVRINSQLCLWQFLFYFSWREVGTSPAEFLVTKTDILMFSWPNIAIVYCRDQDMVTQLVQFIFMFWIKKKLKKTVK